MNDVNIKRLRVDRLLAANDHYRALLAIKELIQNSKVDMQLVFLAGMCCYYLGLFAEASRYYSRCSKKLRSAKAWNMLAECNLQMGKHDCALKQFKKALRLDPANPESEAGVARVYVEAGYYEKAKSILSKLRSRYRYNRYVASALYAYAKEIKDSDVALSYLLEYSESGAPGSDEASFMLANIYDSDCRYHEAFKLLEKSNKALAYQYSKTEYDRYLDAYCNVFASDKFNNLSSDTGSRYIFLVGMPRSGTTLLESSLCQFDGVSAVGELPALNNIATDLANNKRCDYPLCVNNLLPEDAVFIEKEYEAAVQDIAGNSGYIVDKLPHNFVHVGLIKLAMPGAKLIFCRRHPMDVGLSVYSTRLNPSHAYSTDLDDIAHHIGYCEKLLRHWEGMINDDVCHVNYESLVSDYPSVLSNVLDYCNINYNSEQLTYSPRKRLVNTASKYQVRENIYSSSVGRWENYSEFLCEFKKSLIAYGVCLE